MIKKFLKYMAFEQGKLINLYRKICKPRSDENAELLKKMNYFYAIGEGCRINIGATFTDPKYVRIGNNTCLSGCTLIGHEGAIAVLSKSTGKVLDKVGKIDIGNNCFIGHGAIVMPNVVIGNDVIVAAGSIVTKDIESGSIVGGIPAKVIGKTDDYVNKIEANTKEYPWYDVIKERKTVYDDEMEKILLTMRLDYFYGENKQN